MAPDEEYQYYVAQRAVFGRWRYRLIVRGLAIIAVFAIAALVIAVALMARAHARDLGQWDYQSAIASWFLALKQPGTEISCCGEADAYWADETETNGGGQLVAVITDDRPDEPLRRPHVPIGTKIVVPPEKITRKDGNPTGHVVIFLNANWQVYCYVMNGGV